MTTSTCTYCDATCDAAEGLMPITCQERVDSCCKECAETRPTFIHTSGVIFTLTKTAPHWSVSFAVNPKSIITPNAVAARMQLTADKDKEASAAAAAEAPVEDETKTAPPLVEAADAETSITNPADETTTTTSASASD